MQNFIVGKNVGKFMYPLANVQARLREGYVELNWILRTNYTYSNSHGDSEFPKLSPNQESQSYSS